MAGGDDGVKILAPLADEVFLPFLLVFVLCLKPDTLSGVVPINRLMVLLGVTPAVAIEGEGKSFPTRMLLKSSVYYPNPFKIIRIIRKISRKNQTKKKQKLELKSILHPPVGSSLLGLGVLVDPAMVLVSLPAGASPVLGLPQHLNIHSQM